MFYLLIYLSDPDSVGLRVDADAAQESTRAKVLDRCLIGVGPMVLVMCVLNFSFHQPPVYKHPSPIIQSLNSLLANVFCL